MSFSIRYVVSLSLCLALVGCGDDDAVADSGTDMDTPDMTTPDMATPDMATPDMTVPDMAPDMATGCTEGCAIVDIGVGSDYACGRRENGEVLCWGGNLNGQLGDNRMRHMACGMLGVETRDCSATPVTVGAEAYESLAVGPFGACGIEENVGSPSAVYCWGLTDLPPMGLDARQRDFTPEEEVDFPMVGSLDRGPLNTCMVDLTGGVHCRGENESGQVGNGAFVEVYSPVTVPGLTGVEQVAVGDEFACARSVSEVNCWGNNGAGQLGDGEVHEVCGIDEDVYDCSSSPVVVALEGGVDEIAVGGSHACALMGDGTVSCWGANFAGQIGMDTAGADVATPTAVPGITGAIGIAAGGQHTCVLLTGGEAKCWGRNDEGQLGDGSIDHATCTSSGDSFDCSAAPLDVTFAGEFIAIAAGGQNTCGLDASNAVHCWGWNDQRQLGANGSDARERSPLPIEIAGLE